MAGGRPTKYNTKLANEICTLLAQGNSLRKICLQEGMPSREAIYDWLFNHKEFSDQYARAREQQADFYSEQCIEIADDGTNDTYEADDGSKKVAHDHIQRSRLRVDTRKWVAAQMAPRKWGQQQVQHMGEDGGPIKVTVNVMLKKAIEQPEQKRIEQSEDE